MPHKVASFFDPHSILPSFFHEPKKLSIHRLSGDSPDLGSRTPSISSQSSHDSNERTVKMPDSQLKKRISQHLKSSSSKTPTMNIPPNLKIAMESPPVVFYNQPHTSSGALLSGQLRLYVTEKNMVIKDFRMRFVVERTMKKPFREKCTDCSIQIQELTSWNFLQSPSKVVKGEQVYPFSFLLKGDLPASMDGPLSTIRYKFHAVIISGKGEKTELDYLLPVKRAIGSSELPRQSIRIFPPTNLTAKVELPSVIHPIGEAMATMRLNGVIRREAEGKVQHQWKLKRMSWRLDETHKTMSKACSKHAEKVVAKPGEEALTQTPHREVRTIGSGTKKDGWKSDYTTADGSVELEFPFSVNGTCGSSCDLNDEEFMEVTHQLVVELVVAEEQAPNKKPQHSTPTGAARILRMHFNIILTERTGMGISWDEEQPPVYENVPASPPGYVYADMQDYQGTPMPGSSLPPVPDYEQLPK